MFPKKEQKILRKNLTGYQIPRSRLLTQRLNATVKFSPIANRRALLARSVSNADGSSNSDRFRLRFSAERSINEEKPTRRSEDRVKASCRLKSFPPREKIFREKNSSPQFSVRLCLKKKKKNDLTNR